MFRQTGGVVAVPVSFVSYAIVKEQARREVCKTLRGCYLHTPYGMCVKRVKRLVLVVGVAVPQPLHRHVPAATAHPERQGIE